MNSCDIDVLMNHLLDLPEEIFLENDKFAPEDIVAYAQFYLVPILRTHVIENQIAYGEFCQRESPASPVVDKVLVAERLAKSRQELDKYCDINEYSRISL